MSFIGSIPETVPSEQRVGLSHGSKQSKCARATWDAIILSFAVLGSETLCWIAPVPFWAAELIVYGPPLIYLVTKYALVREALDPSFTGKAILFCAVFFTYVGVTYNGWTGPSAIPLVFGVPVEQAMWGALVIPLSIAVNQRFFARPLSRRPVRGARSVIYLVFVLGLAAACVPAVRALFSEQAYLKIGLLIYLPILSLTLGLGRGMVRELLGVGAVFALVHFGFELIAMKHGFWSFHGEYLVRFDLAGSRIPLEELVFIIVLCSPATVGLHALRFNWKGVDRPPSPA